MILYYKLYYTNVKKGRRHTRTKSVRTAVSELPSPKKLITVIHTHTPPLKQLKWTRDWSLKLPRNLLTRTDQSERSILHYGI